MSHLNGIPNAFAFMCKSIDIATKTISKHNTKILWSKFT